MSESLQSHGLQHAKLPEFAQIHVHWVSDAIQSSHPLPPSSPFAFNLSQHQSWFFAPGELALHTRGQSIGASALTSVLPVNIQGWFPLGWLVWSPCSPRDFQEFSPAPQFKSIILYLSFSKPLANTNLLLCLRFAYPEHFI